MMIFSDWPQDELAELCWWAGENSLRKSVSNSTVLPSFSFIAGWMQLHLSPSFFLSQFHPLISYYSWSPSGCLTLLINSTLVQLIASGMVTAAAIAGHDGNIWAKSNGFNASPDEVLLCICVYLAYNNCLLALFNKKIQVKRLLSNWGPNLAMGGVTVNAFK